MRCRFATSSLTIIVISTLICSLKARLSVKEIVSTRFSVKQTKPSPSDEKLNGNFNGNDNIGHDNGNDNGNCFGNCLGNESGNFNGNENNSSKNGNDNGNCVGNCFHNADGNLNGNANTKDGNGNHNGNCIGNCFHRMAGNFNGNEDSDLDGSSNFNENCHGNCFEVPAGVSRKITDRDLAKLNRKEIRKTCTVPGHFTHTILYNTMCRGVEVTYKKRLVRRTVCGPGAVFDLRICQCNQWYLIDFKTCRSPAFMGRR